MNQVQLVWVEEGCICCQACVAVLPAVFTFGQAQAEIVGAMRRDGITSSNEDELCALNEAGIACSDEIIEAAQACPVEIIKFSMSA